MSLSINGGGNFWNARQSQQKQESKQTKDDDSRLKRIENEPMNSLEKIIKEAKDQKIWGG